MKARGPLDRAAFLRGLLALVVLAGCARSLPPPVQPLPGRPAPGAAAAPQPAAPPSAPAVPGRPAGPQPRTEPLAAGPSAPLLVKVGLASDLAAVTLPCCEGEVTVSSGDQVVAVLSPLRVEPAAGSAQHGFYRLQVSALRDEGQARDLAARLARQTGEPADAHFDAGIDLYRIRLGHYGSREEAEADQKRIGALGVTGAWVVSEGAQVSDPALRLTQRGTASLLPGRWLAVATAAGSGTAGMRAEGHRYRGRILIYLNDRGSLNLINELPLEEYLRGVVPSEMGPEQYGQLEALKAQAVAARTYTLKNLGEFSREGYDICATARCQVYSGMEVEHPLSDRAIAETAGQVLLYKGELVDALYSSTCGGHTEDAQVIFPFKQEPYLKGVPCVEAGTVRLDGDLPAGAAFPDELTQRLLPPPSGAAPADALAGRLERLAMLAGLPPPRARLASLDRREVQRFVASTFDLALDTHLLLASEDVAYLVSDPPPGWSEEDRRRAAYLLRSGLVTGPPDRPLAKAEVERMLLAFAELLRVVRREEVSFLSRADGRLTVHAGKEEKVYTLPAHLATFRRSGEEASGAPLGLLPGDGLTLFWQEDHLLAAVQDVDPQGAAYDRSSKWSSWTRFRSDSQIASQVQTRLPGLGYRGFEILSRGVSGRVGKIRIDGLRESVEIEGLAVRWTLDVPDTLFTAKRLEPPNQEPGWLFTGRGWGHGVGMCQVGAYGMALRGHSYRDILLHYYTGVDLGRVRLTSGTGRAAGR
ncbi:MAG TPA: SpoIID/LytB domain-containing protein [Thermoanaerobaculia bacterium]|nr:SpoIID/LytB domain-containing protein [Thermoanaerobaculia bacterium]